MLSRDEILERMRERVHHPAATRELFQLLDVDRDERATFRRHLKSSTNGSWLWLACLARLAPLGQQLSSW